jgi:hypothetical protein
VEQLKRGRETIPCGELNICKYYGIKATPASGAMWSHKSDGTTGTLRIEIKETAAASLSVKKLWLEKIRKEAALTGLKPRLLFRIQEEIWIAMPCSEYEFGDEDETI